MKSSIFIFGLIGALCFPIIIYSQQNIGIGTSTPNASAMLDITSTNKGILVPRVTTVQMNAISSPANGLLVYNIDSTAFAYRSGTSWVYIKGKTDASNSWGTVGNSGTNPATNFIGTTDNQDVVFKRNNLKAGLLNTASQTTAFGVQSLNAMGTGTGNTGIGYQTMFSNTTGSSNTSLGRMALFHNTNVSHSVAIGDSSLFNNGQGANITFDEGQANTAVGSKSFKSNTKGKFGTAIGGRALMKNTTGFFNTAVGYEALSENVTGSANAAFGQGTLYKSNSVGNAAFGVQSLPFLTTGETNTALGWRAGYFNQTGNRNIFIGPESGFNELGSNKLYIENSNADSTNALIFGNFATDKLRINGKTESVFNVTFNDDPALYGENDNTDFYGIGVQGKGGWKGVEGIAIGTGGGTYFGVSGIAESSNSGANIGVYGKAANGINNVAGLFEGKVGIGTAITTSAVLEVTSTSQGFLPPRMTHNQRENIGNPVAGLLLWCTNCGPNGELQVYNGSQWTNMIGGPIQVALGGLYQGGIIAYILQSGDPGYDPLVNHGIIAAPSDLTINYAYGCSQFIPGADSDAIGSGDNNTIEILAACPSAPAALQCSNYTNGGYSDWHLPSKNELNKLYLNKAIIGGFDVTDYWSSTEQGDPNAWKQNFNDGSQSSNGKNALFKVRPVRYF